MTPHQAFQQDIGYKLVRDFAFIAQVGITLNRINDCVPGKTADPVVHFHDLTSGRQRLHPIFPAMIDKRAKKPSPVRDIVVGERRSEESPKVDAQWRAGLVAKLPPS